MRGYPPAERVGSAFRRAALQTLATRLLTPDEISDPAP